MPAHTIIVEIAAFTLETSKMNPGISSTEVASQFSEKNGVIVVTPLPVTTIHAYKALRERTTITTTH